MTYRRTPKYSASRQRAMAAGRDAARMAREIERPADLPELRMRITIERLDFGREVHVIELHRTPRVDQYRATVDGRLWRSRIGLARALSGIRKSLPRTLSPRAL